MTWLQNEEKLQMKKYIRATERQNFLVSGETRNV